jgi:nucleotide-binding universal stress UspA family protein
MADSEGAVQIACSLAADHGAVLTAAFVIEVSPLLPLDARMDDDTISARHALRWAEAIADACGVRLQGRKIRAREAWRAIVELAEEEDAEIIVIAAPRRRRAYGTRNGFGTTVRHVLAKATCRVLVVAPPAA